MSLTVFLLISRIIVTNLEYKTGPISNWIYNVYMHMESGAATKGEKIKVIPTLFLLIF